MTLLGGPEIAPHSRRRGVRRFIQTPSSVLSGAPSPYTATTRHSARFSDPHREVVLDVAADPPQVYLGAVPPGVPLVREVALRSGDDALRLGVPQSEAPHLTLRLGDAPDGSAAAVLAIGTAPDAPPGPFKAEVRVPTSSAQHPVVRVTVAGTIDPAAPVPRSAGSGAPAEDGAVREMFVRTVTEVVQPPR